MTSIGAAPQAHSNVRQVTSAQSPLDKNNNTALGGPSETQDKNRELSQMITGEVNQANLHMGKKLNIFI